MAISGRDEYESLSHMGGPSEGPPVRFGDYTVPSAVAWILQPIGRSPGVRAEFEMRKGQVFCRSVHIDTSGRGITTADLESLPGLERKGLDAFRALAIQVFDDDDWKAGRNLHRHEAIHNPSGSEVGKSLKGRPRDELSAIAEVYRANISDRPVEAVQEHFDLARRTADRRIRAARDAGLLPPTTRGRKNA